MIEYSKQESEIFGVPFGRANLEENFDNWNDLKKEFSNSECRFLRIKIQNPKAQNIDELNAKFDKVHLLDILRVYRSFDVPVENIHRNLRFEVVTPATIHILEDIINETYDDMPFGNYTPSAILKIFPREIQLKALKEYFTEFYDGRLSDKIGYIIYDNLENSVGCLVTDFLENSTYTYYIGVKKEFRSNQIFFRVINFIYYFTKQRDLAYGECAARISNFYSQKTLEKSNMRFVRYDWVYLIEK